jgi:hypothetical protein
MPTIHPPFRSDQVSTEKQKTRVILSEVERDLRFASPERVLELIHYLVLSEKSASLPEARDGTRRTADSSTPRCALRSE